MSQINRRTFLKLLAAGSVAGSASWLSRYANAGMPGISKDFYSVPMKGNARILHMTDAHGQLNPVYFREPNVNLGIGDAFGRPPHLVGDKLLKNTGLKQGSPEAYAYTYLDFEKAARKYGRMGGFANIKAVFDSLREQAGGIDNTLSLDGGDLWQGSGTSLWTRGVDMVEASNILGIDVMVGHWEFTYAEEEVLSNAALFKGDFIGQNVRIKEDSLMNEGYAKLVERFDGRGLYDEDSGHAFRPYVIKKVGKARIAVIGQAFPRTANANPQMFFPDWSFGLREEDMIDLVKQIRKDENPDAIVLLSHNGMDVDIKMAERVPGLNAVFGGHTHDGMPQPVKVKNVEGNTCWVTNAGSNGKYIGVMDFDIQNGKVKDMHYQMLPVFDNAISADKEMQAFIDQMRKTKYDKKIVESRARKYFYEQSRLGKTYKQILDEKLAIADRTLYRRGNFIGTWDQIICNALRWEYDADIAMSAGVRWGTTTLKGDWITMEDVMTQTSMTYAETYVASMTGKEVKTIIEQVADNLFDPDPYLQSGGDMVRLGGLDYTVNPFKKLFKRITDIRLDNGDKLKDETVYQVAGWALVDRIPEGRLMWDIIRDYLVANKDEDDVLRLDKINVPKLIGVRKNPGIADYDGKLG